MYIKTSLASKFLNFCVISIILLVLWNCCGCHGNNSAYTLGSPIETDWEGQKRLAKAACDMDLSLQKSGQIYPDKALEAYLKQIMDKLYPEFKGEFKVHALKAPVLNAFALPNGSIYVNIGMIAALENEAQLATVLAHEGIHYINKHAAKQRIQYQRSVGMSVAISLLGIPFIGDLAALSSIFGYSREKEREADILGYQRLKQAGYDVKQAKKAFEHLAMEAKANNLEEPFFFSTHPRLVERIKRFNQFAKADKDLPGFDGAQIYQQHVASLRLVVLKKKIQVGKFDSVIAVLTHPQIKQIYPAHSMFYLGEAYRLRNWKKDPDRAISAYLSVKDKYPDFIPVYKSLGLLYLKTGRPVLAKQYLETYLKMNPGASDAGFINQYLEQINQRKN